MPLDMKLYRELCITFSGIDFFGRDPGLLPKLSSKSQIAPLVTRGKAFVPNLYKDAYALPLQANLADLVIQMQNAPIADIVASLEPFLAPLYQHSPKSTKTNVRPQLRRFLAVISNLFRSFVNEKKRAAINVPLATENPPLAFFQSNGDQGPYTITSETMQRLLGMPIPVVSLPHSLRDHPVIWSSLTHEVCGHDVVHADPDLVPELVAGIRALFSPQGFHPDAAPAGDALNALIWSYWIDEAVADVYGVLNMGPTFALNLGAFFYAMTARFMLDNHAQPPPVTSLRMDSGPRDPQNGDNGMDEHPTDILRLHLAIGVIENLSGLSVAARQAYVSDIEAVAKSAANGATKIRLMGDVEISHTNWRTINVTVPLAEAQAGARRAGAFIATARLAALGNHTIQDIETWDDVDEKAANDIKARILQNQSVVAAGDDAQLLAGATAAVLERTGIYKSTSSLLNDALDDSYKRDPIWAGLLFDQMFSPGFFAALTKMSSETQPKSRRARQPRRVQRDARHI